MSRNFTIDIVKLCMAALVVTQHGLVDVKNENAWNWHIVNGVTRIAVPFFLVVNGYYYSLALQQNRAQKQWLLHLLYVYCLWTAIYFYQIISNSDKVTTILAAVILGWFHLWYIPGLIASGLLLSFLLRRRATINQIFVASALALITGVIIQYISIAISGNGITARLLSSNHSHRNFIFFSFPFFAIGYLIQQCRFWESLRARSIFAVVILGAILLHLESELFRKLSGGGQTIDNLLSTCIIVPAVFTLALKSKNLPIESKTISYLATGIYFTHPIFLVCLDWKVKMAPALGVLTTLICSIALSSLIIAIKPLRARIL